MYSKSANAVCAYQVMGLRCACGVMRVEYSTSNDRKAADGAGLREIVQVLGGCYYFSSVGVWDEAMQNETILPTKLAHELIELN